MLLDHGHPDAWEYTLGQLADEAALIVQRINGQAVTDALLLQNAAASVLSKEGAKQFKKLIKQLSEAGE